MSLKKKLGAGIAAGALAVMTLGAPAFAVAEAPADDMEVSLAPAIVAPGGDVTVSGVCDAPSTVTVEVEGLEAPLSKDSDGEGVWSIEIAAPEAEGNYNVSAACTRYEEAGPNGSTILTVSEESDQAIITMSHDEVNPGGWFELTGSGYLPEEDVEITYAGLLGATGGAGAQAAAIGGPRQMADGDAVLGTLEADVDGEIQGFLQLPEDIPLGFYALTGTGLESERVAHDTFEVTALPAIIDGWMGDITRDGCRVSIPVTTEGAGDFAIRIWDDGQIIDNIEWTSATEGEESTTQIWTITRPAGEGAPGVGIELVYVTTTGDYSLDMVDPYRYPAEVADACASTDPTPTVKPAATTGGLAQTGGDSSLGLMIGAGAVIVLGAGAMFAARRLKGATK